MTRPGILNGSYPQFGSKIAIQFSKHRHKLSRPGRVKLTEIKCSLLNAIAQKLKLKSACCDSVLFEINSKIKKVLRRKLLVDGKASDPKTFDIL